MTDKIVSAAVTSMMEGLLAHVKPYVAEELKSELDKLAAQCVAKCINNTLKNIHMEFQQKGEKLTVQFEYTQGPSA